MNTHYLLKNVFDQYKLIQNVNTKVNTKCCLSLHYNRANSYLFVNGTETHKFTANDSEIVPNNLCLRNVSKDLSPSNIKKTGFNG